MEIFLYCTYEGSGKGYVLTKLQEEGLVRTEENVPALVYDFFSYDRFSVLWMEGRNIPRTAVKDKDNDTSGYSTPEKALPDSSKEQRMRVKTSFFGVRGLRGRMRNGRTVTSNIALLAEEGEENRLRQAALGIIGDRNRFAGILSEMLTVGGDAGYELDSAAFLQWIQDCPPAKSLKSKCGLFSLPARLLSDAAKADRRGVRGIRKACALRDILKFAVCTCSWENARSILKDIDDASEKPGRVIDSRRFEQEFAAKAPLWE